MTDLHAAADEYLAIRRVLACVTLGHPHDALPERERTILMLRFFGEMTQTQIAERISVSQMQVSRLLSGALSRLRADLLDHPQIG